jgi:hypothetical protein
MYEQHTKLACVVNKWWARVVRAKFNWNIKELIKKLPNGKHKNMAKCHEWISTHFPAVGLSSWSVNEHMIPLWVGANETKTSYRLLCAMYED